jgi:glyceraldehyde-3-phosphate dehydrogenase type I
MRWHRPRRPFAVSCVAASNNSLSIDGVEIPFSSAPQPSNVLWGTRGVDVVLECSGKFRTAETLQPYFATGVKKVIVAAPVKSGALNIVMGVNDHLYDPATHHILTAASCTTNCLAPVVKVLHETIGIIHGVITTVHDITNTQTVVDTVPPKVSPCASRIHDRCCDSLRPNGGKMSDVSWRPRTHSLELRGSRGSSRRRRATPCI